MSTPEENGIEIRAVEGLPAKLAGTVFVKTLSGEDFDAWQDASAALPEKGATGARFANFAAACACKEDGSPLYPDGAAAKKLNLRLLRLIFEAGMDLNGLSAPAKDQAKKD